MVDNLTLDPQAPPFLANPSEDIRTVLNKDLYGLQNGDPQSCKNIVDLNLYFLKTIHTQEAKIARLESDSKPVQAQFRELERLVSLLTHENQLLKQQIALVEDASKILSLRIEGLQERSGENLVTYVASTLSRTGVSCTYEDIDYAKRIGKYKQGSTRPILVKFIRESKRNLILYNRSNLNRNSNTLVWINDDVSDITRRQRKTVREIAAYAKTQGIPDLKIHGDGLVLGNNKYRHQDLDLLPAHLSIIKAKQIADESDLYFQGEYSPFSNFFSCPIYDEDDICYNSAEQFFQHKKAMHHEFLFTANKIMLTWDPYEIKRLGNLIPTSQDWLQKEEEVMKDILGLKFAQNPELADLLKTTGQLHLHEATADAKWATGAELSSKAIQTGQWGGSDRMGFLLEQFRSDLRDDSDTDSPPPLEGDDILPMPDEGEDNTTLDLLPLPNQSSPTPHLSQHPLPRPNTSDQPSTHSNKQSKPQAQILTHLQAQIPTHPNQDSYHAPSTYAGIVSSPTKPTHIQPLMQCNTTKAVPEKIPQKISARAPAAQHVHKHDTPPTKSPPTPRPPPPTTTPNKSQQLTHGAKPPGSNTNPGTSDRAPVRRSTRPIVQTSRFSQQ